MGGKQHSIDIATVPVRHKHTLLAVTRRYQVFLTAVATES